MASYTDALGRAWPVEVNVGTVRLVRSKLDVNLLDVIEDECDLLSRIYGDSLFLADVLFVMLQAEVERRELDCDEFLKGLRGDALEQAADALSQEIANFFPSPQKRATILKVISKAKEIALKAETTVTTQLAVEMDRIDVDSLAKQLIDSAGNSPAASESAR